MPWPRCRSSRKREITGDTARSTAGDAASTTVTVLPSLRADDATSKADEAAADDDDAGCGAEFRLQVLRVRCVGGDE